MTYVFQLPTMCAAPETMTTDKLIAHVHYLQREILGHAELMADLMQRHHDAVGVANAVTAKLLALVDSYDAGDQAAILYQVKQLAESRTAQKRVH